MKDESTEHEALSPTTPTTATAERVWLRFQASLVAPFMDDESRHRNVLDGWTLVATSSTARAALARMLACTFERLTSLGDSWHALSPDSFGARLHGIRVLPSRQAYDDLFDHGDDGFDLRYETAPAPTSGSLRVAGAIAAALVTGGEQRRLAPQGPKGVPPRLALLHEAVSWWASVSVLSVRSDDPTGVPLQRPNAPSRALFESGIWSARWPFEIDDLARAVQLIWARIGAYDPEVDWVAEATDAAWLAWHLARSDVGASDGFM